jgi:hypothetical protein
MARFLIHTLDRPAHDLARIGRTRQTASSGQKTTETRI